MISVIIPNHNREDVIGKAIEAVLNSDLKDFEIIVVDDASTDRSLDVIRRYPVKLECLPKNAGPAAARNRGAKMARGSILIFVDSDVLIPNEALTKVAGLFSSRQDVSAVTGMPAFQSPFKNLSSRHFNWRIHFNYYHLPDFIDFTYGSFVAVKKPAFDDAGGFNENLKRAGIEDDEFGYDLLAKGHKIFLDKSLKIVHCKHIGFFGLLRNDFNRTLDRVELMFRRRKVESIITSQRFISTPFDQLVAPLTLTLFWVCFILSFWKPDLTAWGIFSFLAFLFSQARYFIFLANRGSGRFVPQLAGLLFIDMTVVACALAFGAAMKLGKKL